jgi:hypothetical protein
VLQWGGFGHFLAFKKYLEHFLPKIQIKISKIHNLKLISAINKV